MEQPGELRPDPLDPEIREHRVRAILGLTTDDVLPVPDKENLRTYRQYLATHLHFPFEARFLFKRGGRFPGIRLRGTGDWSGRPGGRQ